MEDYMVLANYVKSFPVNADGLHEIPADDARYASVYGEGRIKQVQGFDDVPIDTFYYDAAMWALEEGITTGATGSSFHPDGDLQRAQVVTMLWRAAGKPEVEAVENPFVDVAEDDWFYTAVMWAVEKGITNGVDADHFAPYGITNRAQAITFLWRAMEKPDASVSNDFDDVIKGQWYESAINWAVENRITNGMSDNLFGVNTNCNRAHMVTFLYRAIG
jgi:hypothetical protein